MKLNVVVFPLLVAANVELALPCKVSVWLVAPIVKVELGVIEVSAVRLVMSPFVPEAAAPRFVLAPEAVVALVPPFAIGS